MRDRAEVRETDGRVVRIQDLMTVRGVAELHNVGTTQIKRAVRDGRLESFEWDGRYMIHRRSAEAFVPRREVGRPRGSKDRSPRRRRTRAELAE